jgi:hypothetical protein
MSSEQEQTLIVDRCNDCVSNTYNQLRTYADPDSLYGDGLYDRQMAEQMCVEGFGCKNTSGNFEKFIIVLMVIAVVAYFLSTHKIQLHDLGLGAQSGGSYRYKPSFAEQARRITGLKNW